MRALISSMRSAVRPEADDLLEHKVGAVEPERELVGPERPERLLAADQLDVTAFGRH